MSESNPGLDLIAADRYLGRTVEVLYKANEQVKRTRKIQSFVAGERLRFSMLGKHPGPVMEYLVYTNIELDTPKHPDAYESQRPFHLGVAVEDDGMLVCNDHTVKDNGPRTEKFVKSDLGYWDKVRVHRAGIRTEIVEFRANQTLMVQFGLKPNETLAKILQIKHHWRNVFTYLVLSEDGTKMGIGTINHHHGQSELGPVRFDDVEDMKLGYGISSEARLKVELWTFLIKEGETWTTEMVKQAGHHPPLTAASALKMFTDDTWGAYINDYYKKKSM